MASVSIQCVSKRFGEMIVVNSVDLSVSQGELMVLLGPSGCGKTTTLRMVAGLEELSEGRILIGDRDVSYLPPKDRDIAMVFQNYALYPHMTVYENMSFGLKLRHTANSEINRRVTEAGEILGLGPFLQRRPKELSGGQRQRVALGRAIVREPQVFLMDEPLSNLDAKLRTQTRVELKRLHQRLGATILYVTHDQTEAMTLGTRIVVMKDGVVQQVDTPDGIYHRPVNEFVATFVGTPAMNLIPAELVRQDNTVWAQIGDQRVSLPGCLARAVEGLATATVRLGIRPENLYLAASPQVPQTADNTLTAVIRLIEPMGHENIVYCRVGDADWVIRTDNAWYGQVGDTVTLGFDSDRLHAFNPDDGRSLVFGEDHNQATVVL